MIFLDHAATYPIWPAASDAMKNAPWGNPHSLHWSGFAAHSVLRDVEFKLRKKLGIGTVGQIVWTANGSMANMLAFLMAETLEEGDTILSAVEHKSVLYGPDPLGRIILPVYPSSRARLDKIPSYITNETKLVSVMMVNNETGAINDICALRNLVHDRDILIHVDGVHALGKTEISLEQLDVDMFSISAHKVGGPKGVGALWVSDEVWRYVPYLGTPNVPGIAGFGAMMEEIDPERWEKEMRPKTKFFYQQLQAEGIQFQNNINVDNDHVVAGILNLWFPDVDSETLQMKLSDRGVFVSPGSACNNMEAEPSHVLRAIGHSRKRALESMRFSLGYGNNYEQLFEAAGIIAEVIREIR